MKIFEKFQKMSDEGKDIRLAPQANIQGVDINTRGGIVHIAVDLQTAHDLMNNKEFYGGLLLADKKQCDEIE
ncbi:MAG: hypothetical protein C4519_24235 [Desulfobacteraceae bacterium]|nr:MAG: hypothetical protein C4519_24235 [Desulfobacteraceae bacterium]